MNEYTNVVEGVWQCNDCGAHADSKEDVAHHESCTPGESKKWEESYGNEEKIEELTKRIKHYEKTLETGINQNNGKPVEKKHVLALTATLILLRKQKRDATQ